MQAGQKATCACVRVSRCSDAAFVGVEGYQADGSIGELNQNDIKPTAYEEYLFVRFSWMACCALPLNRRCSLYSHHLSAPTQDLNGYLVLKGAVDKQHVSRCNAVLDEMPLQSMQPGDWWGRVHGHS
jgi:hypothetical protein